MSPLVFYSHSDYSDVWPALFTQTDHFLPDTKKYLLSDNDTEDLDNDWVLIKYDDSLRYQRRLTSCLEQVEEEMIIFHHEDMFLYDTPDIETLEELEKLVETEEIDIIKLTRASYNEHEPLVSVDGHKNLFLNPKSLSFAIQPSICNKDKLSQLYGATYGENIWQFESNSSLVCNHLNIKTAMTYTDGDNKRGMYHWDSSIYPYFATAIVKGKWNLPDYGNMLRIVLEESGIDMNIRGTA